MFDPSFIHSLFADPSQSPSSFLPVKLFYQDELSCAIDAANNLVAHFVFTRT